MKHFVLPLLPPSWPLWSCNLKLSNRERKRKRLIRGSRKECRVKKGSKVCLSLCFLKEEETYLLLFCTMRSFDSHAPRSLVGSIKCQTTDDNANLKPANRGRSRWAKRKIISREAWNEERNLHDRYGNLIRGDLLTPSFRRQSVKWLDPILNFLFILLIHCLSYGEAIQYARGDCPNYKLIVSRCQRGPQFYAQWVRFM